MLHAPPAGLGDTLHDDTPVVLASQDDEEDEYQERLRVAVDMVAEMQLTAEQLKVRTLTLASSITTWLQTAMVITASRTAMHA